jgi:hypothetical protein
VPPIRAAAAEGIRRRRLDALEELRGDVEVKMLAVQNMTPEAARAHAAAARISRADHLTYTIRLEAPDHCRLLLKREAVAEKAA